MAPVVKKIITIKIIVGFFPKSKFTSKSQKIVATPH